MKNIIFTGGGTAGHIMPNVALFPYFKDEYKLHYVGEPNSMEEEIIKKYPYVTFHAVKSVKLIRSMTLKNLSIPFKVLKAKSEGKKLLKEIKPVVIFSKGGFASLPVTLASKDIPIIIHESDASLGLANKVVVKKAKHLCTSFSFLAENYENGVTTGAPLRQELYNGNKDSVTKQYLFSSNQKPNLLIFGGSLGAKAINEAVTKSIKQLTEKFNVIHITGKNNSHPLNYKDYYQVDFAYNIADYFKWADFCISRGGANALFELTALKIPSLIIPLPKGNSRGDQVDNARYFAEKGYVLMLEQEHLDQSSLITNLDKLMSCKDNLKDKMAYAQNIDGSKKIADLVKTSALIKS